MVTSEARLVFIDDVVCIYKMMLSFKNLVVFS